MTNDPFVNNTLSELQDANDSPIFGYENSPILTLEEAVEKIIPLVPSVADDVTTAKKKCNRRSDLLTPDESAAIYLYSMATPFFSTLNNTLRAEKRDELKPWFAFLKLFITALEKLPTSRRTVWRGVAGEVGSEFADGDVHTWWSVNSCTMDLTIVQPILGENGTLFAIDTIRGKDISAFSAFPAENEILLMPGTRLIATSLSLNIESRFFFIHLIEKILQSTEPQSESNHLFELIKHSYRRNGHIERLMNPAKTFPIEHSYVNLAIVETKKQHEKEKQLRDASHTNAIMGSFEEIYGTKTVIDIKNIFETCKNQEKQVLVFGRAGIGKSTFSRYIAYQWAMGSYWPQYVLLVLIPLRRLTINRYPLLPLGQSYSLIDLVKKEVFPFDLSETDDKLLKKQFDPKKTLWILDGYDEIVQNVPPHLECLFEQLLKTPHHILTSRPYLNTLAHPVQMEITGFTDDNIQQYVQQFFNQMQDELDDALIKSEALLTFLRGNPRIWGVAHIPVNLELICSFWSNENSSEIRELTITTLYNLMIEWLCRRYLTLSNKPMQNFSKDEIDQRCQKELAFLECLAFNAMESNTIILRPSLLKKAWNEANVSLQECPHLLNIGILKSFNQKGIGTQIQTDKDHYFVHLSFQEYFAARYLINALNGSSNDKAIKFIQHQKYNQRYTLVFNFMSGLLSESNAKPCLNTFWDVILGEPSDLVGIRHIQLVISCIEEASDTSVVPQRTKLLRLITNCIEYAFHENNGIIRRHLLPSLQRAQSVACDETIMNTFINLLQCENKKVRSSACEGLGKIGEKAATNEVITKLVSALADESEGVRWSACAALGKIGEKAAANKVITKLVSALGDESEFVRESACVALGKIGEKAAANKVITKLVSALADESEFVRESACAALGKIGEKAATNEVITKLVSALGDKSERVRWSACVALVKIGEKAATNEVITKLVSALGYESKEVRKSACVALVKIGEKAATNEVITKLVSALGDKSERVRWSACIALVNIGEEAATNEVITRLVSALGDETESVGRNACVALVKIGEKAATNEVIAKLVSALGDENERVRFFACFVLGEIGEKAATDEVITKLVSALGDETESVGMSACFALGKIGEKGATNEVITKLVSAVGDESERVRSSACVAVGNIGEKAATNEVIAKLVSALGDENERVRWSACFVLGEIGEKAATDEVITKLVSALGDENELVRFFACFALGKIGEKAATNEVTTKLVSALGDESEGVRKSACLALGKIGEKAATNEVTTKLVSALGDESEGVRKSACLALGKIGEKAATNEVITKLVSALGDESEGVRRSACFVLGEIGEKAATNEAITKLVSALGDESQDVRESACFSLGNIGKKAATNEVIAKLVSALGDENGDVRKSARDALGKIGEKGATNELITKLVSALGDGSEDVRRSACEALGNIGEKAATNEVITRLVSALGDETESVGRSACEALGKIGEKAATNEVIAKLVPTLSTDQKDFWEPEDAIENILNSPAVIIELGPKLISDLCLCGLELRCLRNISANELIRSFFTTENTDWLSAIAHFTLLQGVAVSITKQTMTVYDEKEPLEMLIPSLKLGQELTDAFTNQAKRLNLCFEMQLEDRNKS